MLITTIAIKNLPAGLARAVAALNPKGNDVKIEARATAYASTNSQMYHVANALVTDLDNPDSVTVRRGVWGGDNGFNKAPADRAWDPVFDDQPRDVPLGGAILVGTIGRFCSIYVHPETFAVRFCTSDVARDAIIEGRTSEASMILDTERALTDDECAILYAHHCYKSGEYRQRVVKRYTTALESCITRGFIKRAKNGACQITTQGKALEASFRKRGESLAMRV